jgi:putative hydrolase of HD superfamily
MSEATPAQRLAQQLAFLLEVDRLKLVLRQSSIADGSRRENSAEHSWHLVLFALVLAEHADEPVDVTRVLKMLVLHDVVEVDAGDFHVYDDANRQAKADAEQAAADRLYGMLPEDQGAELRALWEEFEAKETADARFAAAVDRLQPVLLNVATDGEAWQRLGITGDRVRSVNQQIGRGSTLLWEHVQEVLDHAEAEGMFGGGS